MGIFDLLLIATVLGSVIAVLIDVVLWIAGRRRSAGRIFLALVGYLSLYFAALIITSIFSHQRQVSIGVWQCFDDWCLKVVDVHYENGRATLQQTSTNVLAVVTAEVSNRGRGRAQSEPGTFLYLVDEVGSVYRRSTKAQEEYEQTHGPTPPLTSKIPAGQSIQCIQIFEVPRDARHLKLIIGHPFGPGFFVIGDSDSFLHKKTIVPLPELTAKQIARRSGSISRRRDGNAVLFNLRYSRAHEFPSPRHRAEFD